VTAQALRRDALTFDIDGAVRLDRAALSILPELDALAARYPADRAGTRLHGDPALTALVAPGGILQRAATDKLGDGARAVRAILFDKSPAANWALGWHQDRTIAVKARREVEGFAPWTVKAGIAHVAPPFALLERMVTIRVHLDDVPQENAPLLVAPGSHHLGLVPESEMEAAIARCGTYACLAKHGDVWLYATPILHASDRTHCSARRRVLQIDFAAEALPLPLEWLGV
jgi:ectoine hydroxylase-related dioxygenase (phytanoyl-CoA dioxygenase family)